jgi:hypothetical protein
MVTGTRVAVKDEYSNMLFIGSTGTVVDSAGDIWEVWVRLDVPVIGGYTFGFLERELTILSEP